MIEDPYQVLGVSPNASDDEIKAAYRKLVKQYHPDVNPGNAAAAEKIKQINAAYDQIKNPPSRSGQSGSAQGRTYTGYADSRGYYSDPFGFGGYASGSQSSGESYADLRLVEVLLREYRFRSALQALAAFPENRRGGRWYYLSALANYGAGNPILAFDHIQRALQMEPQNPEYLQALHMMQSAGRQYRQTGRNYAYRVPNPVWLCGSLCLSMLLCRLCFGLAR